MNKNIELGDEVKDVITGFTGIVVCSSEWLNKCVRVQVQSRSLDKDGKVGHTEHFDIEQVELVKKSVVNINKEYTGGPQQGEDNVKAHTTRK